MSGNANSSIQSFFSPTVSEVKPDGSILKLAMKELILLRYTIVGTNNHTLFF